MTPVGQKVSSDQPDVVVFREESKDASPAGGANNIQNPG